MQICQVAHHTTTGHPQRLLPHFDPAVPHPLTSLVVGQEFTAQQGLRLLPERKRLVRSRRLPGLGDQVFKGISINPQAWLLGQLENGALVALFQEFLATGCLQNLAQHFAR